MPMVVAHCSRIMAYLYLAICLTFQIVISGGDTVPGSHDRLSGSHDTLPGSHDIVQGSHDTLPGSHDIVPGSHDTMIKQSDTQSEPSPGDYMKTLGIEANGNASEPRPETCIFRHGTLRHLYCRLFNETRFPEIGKSLGESLYAFNVVHSYFTNNTLSRESLVNVSGVRMIQIHYCHIVHVNNDTFADFTNLEQLNLGWNPISQLSYANMLCSTPPSLPYISMYMPAIDLFGGHLPITQRTTDCIAKNKIVSYDFSANYATSSLISNLLCNLKNAFRVVLSDMICPKPLVANINFFNCLSDGSLEELDLSGNELVGITQESFTYLTGIKSLNLSSCHLALHIDQADVFAHLTSVEQLSLRQNNFKLFMMFSNLSEVQFLRLNFLDLSGNRFWWFSAFKENAFPVLDTLYINENQHTIEHVPNNFLSELAPLKKLQMNKNSYFKIKPYAFRSNSLEELHLEYMVVDLTLVNKTVFRHAVALKRLSLNYLNKDSIMPAAEQKETLQAFCAAAFQNLGSLETLSLRDSRIQTLSSAMFLGTNRLISVDLTSNYIQQLPDGIFSTQHRLEVLHIEYNLLNAISHHPFPKDTKTVKIYGSFNPWACDCDLYWLTRTLTTTGDVIIADDVTDYTCDTPSAMYGVKVVDYTPTYRDCYTTPMSSAFYTNASLTGIMCITVLIASLLYRFRWHIKYIYIWMFNQIRAVHDTREYRYDAFVCYHNTDTSWVAHTLRRVLEDEEGLSLCLHDRNWLPGIDIVDNISESIRCSRKTVLVVTNAFTQSNWCQLELIMAQQRQFSEDRGNVILVIKERVLDCFISTRLALQMRTQTYIQWDESEMGQSVFWKRLSQAIKGPSRSVINTV